MVIRDNDGWFWALALGATLIVIGVLYGSGGKGVHAYLPLAVPPSAAAPQPGGPVRSDSPPRPTARHPDIIASVFECRSHGQRVFSDARCGPGARVRSVAAPSRMDPQDTSILDEPVAAQRPAQTAPAAVAAVGDARECAAIEREQDAINARMREGYGAAEGGMLRERLRALSDHYHALRCRHFH